MTANDLHLAVYILAIPLLVMVPVVIKLRKRRLFAFFRVIDGRTKAPLAGAKVFRVARRSRSLGKLDETGTFRGVFWPNSGAFTVEAPGLVSGLIGTESVSWHLRYPDKPYVCEAHFGAIRAPADRSPVSVGLKPGQVEEAASGIVNLYEKPARHEEWICWPTLEEANANNVNGGFARYWKVTGTRRGPGTGGTSFMIAVETVERCKESDSTRGEG
ncbi:MAG: hypothetical protein IV100_07030 [Myxococcales bacterium]|nr:hypothetical protein [Myxococcales bacterium]